MTMKRSGVIGFHAKFAAGAADDPDTILPPPDLDEIRNILRNADPQLSSLDFFSWTDEDQGVWYQADVEGFWLKRDLRRIADQVAKSIPTMVHLILWISDEDGNESGLEVSRGSVVPDRLLTD